MDIISQMTPTDWFLVAVVIGLLALTGFIIYLALEEPVKNYRKRRARERAKAAAEEEHKALPD